MKKEISFYSMENNKYMGNCCCLVCKFDEIPKGFTGNDVIILVKPNDSVSGNIKNIDDFRTADLFGNINPFLRIGSECMLGVMGDSPCNCEEERGEALGVIGRECGVYIHMPQEAQGMGLYYKAQELHLQVHGYMPDGRYIGCKSQSEAAAILTGNRSIDSREYSIVGEIMKDLGLDDYGYRFMSRNPNKVKSLKRAGIDIVSMYDINTNMNENNIGEYLTKWIDKGYCFTNSEVVQLTKMITADIELPERATDLLKKAAELLSYSEGREYLQKHMHTSEEVKASLFSHIIGEYRMRKTY